MDSSAVKQFFKDADNETALAIQLGHSGYGGS